MNLEIKIPAVGESITEATILEWNKNNGEYVQQDDVLLTLETDKASVEVVAEKSGLLSTKVSEGETVEIGALVGEIDTDAAPPLRSSSDPSQDTASAASPSAVDAQKADPPSTPITNAHPDLQKTLSPSALKLAQEKGVSTEALQGSGRGGRIIKEDIQKTLATVTKGGSVATPDSSTKTSKESATLKAPPRPQPGGVLSEESSRLPMSRLRQTIAKRLVEAQHTAAILTTFNEIDMSAVMELRKKYKENFKKKYDVNLGFMGFFVKASIEALKAFPRVNGLIDGKDVILNHFYNIGIAVGTEKGLLVPVIKQASHLSLAEVELTIRHFALKARDGKISLDDLNGGTFTISNGGTYGSMMSTPILNPPQSGILGLHKIEPRPVVIDGKIEIRPMMYVALSYDHRIIDGSESVQFLVKIKECIEDPSRIFLEI